MKKIYLVLLLLFIVLGVACDYDKCKVNIDTDRSSYEITSSSIQGIVLSPKLELSRELKNIDIRYKWTTSFGGFINPQANNTSNMLLNTGGGVMWTAISEGINKLEDLVEIKLEVVRKDNGKIITENKIKIQRKEDKYEILK